METGSEPTAPANIDQMFNRAHAAWRSDRWAEAEAGYRALLAARPFEAHHNLGILYAATGRFAEAEAAYRTALTLNPQAANTREGLARLLLGEGRYAEGWPLFEARREIPALKIQHPRSFPEWRGEDLAGVRLLVVWEQGLGDQIMFARFIPELKKRGASVVFLCDAPLALLFRSCGFEAVAVAEGGWPKADLWVLAGSLPLRLGVTLETLTGEPFLKVTPQVGGGLGVRSRGGDLYQLNRYRSLPSALAAKLEGLGTNLDPAVSGARDFHETARIIAGLDLIITVDTSVAHLAGALGTPVWILLGAPYADWRWLRGRADSPWYDSARLYRLEQPHVWEPLFDRVIADLEDVRAGRRSAI